MLHAFVRIVHSAICWQVFCIHVCCVYHHIFYIASAVCSVLHDVLSNTAVITLVDLKLWRNTYYCITNVVNAVCILDNFVGIMMTMGWDNCGSLDSLFRCPKVVNLVMVLLPAGLG